MRKTLTLALLAAAVAPLAMPTAANAQPHPQMHDGRDRHDDRRRDDIHRDWRDYREHHRRDFSRGHWSAPFRYQRWRPGLVLRPSYYAPRFYLYDYARYRLPPPGRGLRWVRHYDDVLLVNIRSGRIIEVYYGFFW